MLVECKMFLIVNVSYYILLSTAEPHLCSVLMVMGEGDEALEASKLLCTFLGKGHFKIQASSLRPNPILICRGVQNTKIDTVFRFHNHVGDTKRNSRPLGHPEAFQLDPSKWP